MKKILILFAVAGTLAACKNNANQPAQPQQAQAFKQSLNPYANPYDGTNSAFEPMQNNAFLSGRVANDELVETNNGNTNGTANTPQANVPPKQSGANNNTPKDNDVAVNNTPTNTGTGTTTAPAETKKKGWSNKAKGAVIGGASGAVLGVIVDKNNVRGGVIGAAVGTAVGLIVGNEKDKKAAKKKN